MKKRILSIVAVVVCVCIVCGCFYLVKKHYASKEGKVELTEIQKITTRDLDKDYPATPREVVKLFNKILNCYYNESCTEEELRGLTDCAWGLLDAEVQEENPQDTYYTSVQAEIAVYKEHKKTINQSSVCDSDEVVYKTDPENGDSLAYVNASYFVKEDGQFNNTHQMYVLRKDADDRWKILVFYQIEGTTSEEE